MSTNQVGRLLFAGFEDTHFTPDCQAAKLIRDHGVSMFIIKKYNFESVSQLKQLIADLQAFAYSLSFPNPLVMAIDYDTYYFISSQERSGMTRFPQPLALAATCKSSYIYSVGRAIGLELRALGINMAFGPVLDICSKMLSQVVGLKCFGASIEEVTKYGGAFAYGLKNAGLLTSGAHFPGIGKSFIDSISNSPLVLDDIQQLQNVNIVPFRKLIDHGMLDSIRVTVASLPNALSGEVNACLNPTIVDDLLRNGLKYDKLVFSECLELNHIIVNYGIGQAALLVIAYAHCDMVTVCRNYNFQLEALDFLQKSFQNGDYKALLSTALRRIDDFVSKLTWFDAKVELTDEFFKSHEEIASKGYQDSITLIKDLYGIIPLGKYFKQESNFSCPIPVEGHSNMEHELLLLTPESNDTFSRITNDFIKIGKQNNCQIKRVNYNTYGMTRSIENYLNECSVAVCFVSDLCNNIYQSDLLRAASEYLEQSGKHLIVISLDSPYYFSNTDAIATVFICTYAYSYDALKYLPELLFGSSDMKGRMPGSKKKFNDKETVVMGLSNTLTNSEWQFDFLLNKTNNPKPLSNISSDASIDFNRNSFSNELQHLDHFGHENDTHEKDNVLYARSNCEEIQSSENTCDPVSKTDVGIADNVSRPENNNGFHDPTKVGMPVNGNTANGNHTKSEINGINDHNRDENARANGISSTIGEDSNFNTSKQALQKERPWVVEEFDAMRDISAFFMIRDNTINDIYFPLENITLSKMWYFADKHKNISNTFIVRNPSMGIIHGVVTVIVDDYEKCGRIIYMVVSKTKRRQGVGEILHKHAIQYLTIQRGCTTIALGCAFPFVNYLTPKVLDELGTVWHYLETKDNSKINIDETTIQLVGFYKALGWDQSRHKMGVYQQIRKYIMYLDMTMWKFPGEVEPIPNLNISTAYDFIEKLSNMNMKFAVSNDTEQAFNICHYLLKTQQIQDDEEAMFTLMYNETKKIIHDETVALSKENKRKSTMILYVLIDDQVSGACIIYDSNSYLSYYYPLVERFKGENDKSVAGITGLFVGSMPSEQSNYTAREFTAEEKYMVKLGLVSTAVEVIKRLDIHQTIIHNISKEELEVLEGMGFKKFIEYCACFGKKKAFEWVV